jgi:uncharacterized protein (UPF0335 family)
MYEELIKGYNAVSDLFPIVASVLGTIITMQFKSIVNKLEQLNESVKQLNTEVATVIKDQQWHKEELNEIKTRLSYLESRNLKH